MDVGQGQVGWPPGESGIDPEVATPHPRPSPNIARYPIAIALFGVVAIVVFAMNLVFGEAMWGPGTSTVLAWVVFAIHIVACRRTLNAFDPSIWVPVVMLLFYMGVPVAIYVFGFGSYDTWEIGTPPALHQGFGVALLAIVALILGNHIAGFRDLSRLQTAPERSIMLPASCLLWAGFVMVLVGVVTVGAGILFATYGTVQNLVMAGQIDNRLFGTGMLFCQAGVMGVVACHDSKRPIPTLVALAIGTVLALLLIRTGDRGGLSALLFGVGWVFSQSVRRVPIWIVVAGFVFAFVLVPVLGEFRIYGDAADAERKTIRMLLGEGFITMGSSVNAFCYTIDAIPRIKPYDWGMSFVSQMVENVPNIGINTQRNVSSLATIDHAPARWLTSYANPTKFWAGTGGYGYAMGAEWYFNFGLPGVLLGLTWIGWVGGKVRNACRANSLWMTVAALYLAMMMLLIRNSLGWPARTMLWPLVGLLVLRWLLPKSAPVADPSTVGTVGVGEGSAGEVHPRLGA